jgi:hypothetical protein
MNDHGCLWHRRDCARQASQKIRVVNFVATHFEN